MTMPNLNDFDDDIEFTRRDIIWIIFNILVCFIIGWDKMVYLLVIITFATAVLVFSMICFKMCCWPNSRQAVFAPFGREHFD